MARLDHSKEQVMHIENQIEDTNAQIENIKQRIVKLEQEKKKFAASRKFKEASSCQASVKSLSVDIDKYSTYLTDQQGKHKDLETDMQSNMEEVDQLKSRLEEITTQVEKEHQKYLMYRIYDINDMIRVLRPFSLDSEVNVSSLMQNTLSAKDAKTKKHALEMELIKM